MATCRSPTYLFLQIHERRIRRSAGCDARADDHVVCAVAPGARRQKIKPSSAVNIALHRRRARGARVAAAGSLHVSDRVPGRHRASSTGRRSWATPTRARPRTGSSAVQRNPPIHAVLMVHGASAADIDSVCERTAPARRRHGGRGQRDPRPCRADTGRRPTTSRSGSTTAWRSRRLQGITGDGVPTGEFILGYQNHYRIIPPTPVVGRGRRP